MSDNIVDFTQRLKKIKDHAEKPVPVEALQLPDSAILMDPIFQLDTLMMTATHLFLEGDMGMHKYHRMLSVLRYIFDGVWVPFGFHGGVVARTIPNEPPISQQSVYMWGKQYDRMTEGCEGGFVYQMETSVVDFEDMVIDKGTIYPDTWMKFSIPSDCIVTERLPKALIRAMNTLVKINGGFGNITDIGYSVVLPYSGSCGLIITLSLENRIELLPEDQRKNP